jgi:serine/threonine-protein kinase
MQILMAHVYDPVTPLTELRPDVPADLEEIILRCLSKDPRDRYPDAESLEQALAECTCADLWDRHQAAGWWRTQVLTAHQEPAATAAI